MFYMEGVKNGFLKDVDDNIKEADARWIDWWGSLEAGPFNTDCKKGHECVSDPQILPGINDDDSSRRLRG